MRKYWPVILVVGVLTLWTGFVFTRDDPWAFDAAFRAEMAKMLNLDATNPLLNPTP